MKKRKRAFTVTVLLLGGMVLNCGLSCQSRNEAPGNASRPSAGDSEVGVANKGEAALADEDRKRPDIPNVVRLTAEALKKRGHSVTAHETWLEHSDSGFTFRPQLVSSGSGEGGGFQTTTTIRTRHPVLVPEGVFEYQHAVGETEEASILEGFDGWIQLDLVVLLDALRQKPQTCSALELSFPAKDGVPARDRRAVLGPVQHMVLSLAQADGDSESKEEHPFCSCCFLVKNLDAFEPLIESDKFCAIRFYAARDQNGVPAADCRVNGEDWEEGASALRDYVRTWPQRGLESRKQYVVLQNFKKRDPVKLEGAQAEPSHAPEPAAGPDSSGESSPPAR